MVDFKKFGALRTRSPFYGNCRFMPDFISQCDINPYVFFCLLAILISGCAAPIYKVADDYKVPEIDIPESWTIDCEAAAETANTAWWEQFQDPELDKLIETVIEENKDLRIAAARVEEFEGRLQVEKAALYPRFDYVGIANRNQVSENRARPISPYTERVNSDLGFRLESSWEMDLWGRIESSTAAGRADLLSAEENRQAIILTLVSAVAQSYIELLSLDKQLEITKETLTSREEWLRLFEKKSEGGQISGLAFSQATSAYELIASQIPRLKLSIALRENSLCLLLGRYPGSIERGKIFDSLGAVKIPEGVPSDLLVRRPDIRKSEQDLMAANARINIARTRYFPNISLTGRWGYASSQLENLADNSSIEWTFGADIVGPLFSGGRIKGGIQQAKARQQQLLDEYLRTIQTAFIEVEDSLVTMRQLEKLDAIQADRIETLKDTVDFAASRYDSGYSSYLEVMIAENDLYHSQIGHVLTRNSIFAAMIAVYKAIGGGWVTKAEERAVGTVQKPAAME